MFVTAAMERRWGNRVELDENVTVMRDGELVGVARLQELSLSGAFLRAKWRLPLLARVHVEVPRIRGERRSRDTMVEAFVARQSDDGMGLEWCEFAPPGVAAIMEERREIAPVLVRDPAYGGDGASPRRRMR